jgi:hypothetical protein
MLRRRARFAAAVSSRARLRFSACACVEHPVQAVLDGPVRADGRGETVLGDVGAGDAVGDLRGHAALGAW